MMAKVYLMLVALLLLSIQSFAVAETSDEECSAEFKKAVEDDDEIYLRQVPCFASTAETCGEQRTFFTDCDVCCAPGRKPEPSGCVSFQENRGEGSFCGGIVSYESTLLGVDSCKDNLYCDGDSDSETYLTCVTKPAVDEFDCTDASEVDAILQGTLDCFSYLFLGEPRRCNSESKRCEVLPSVGSECSDDDDEGFRCSDYGMTCDEGKCRFLEEGEKCGSDAEEGLEDVSCRTGYECTSSGSSSTIETTALGAGKSGVFAFGEEPEGDEVQTCVRKLQGGDSCGYPGKSCPGSAYCDGAPNGKEDDARRALDPILLGAGASVKQMFLRCGVFCEGKVKKIDYTGPPDPSNGDCVCQEEDDENKRCSFGEWTDQTVQGGLVIAGHFAIMMGDPRNIGNGGDGGLLNQAIANGFAASQEGLLNFVNSPGAVNFRNLLFASELGSTTIFSDLRTDIVTAYFTFLGGGPDSFTVDVTGEPEFQPGSPVLDSVTPITFTYYFDSVTLLAPSSAPACPSNTEAAEKLEEEWKGKTGSCAAPGFIQEDHNVDDECFTATGGRVCHNGGQMSGPDTKCDTTTTCVDRKLGATATFKRFGFIEDFDYGDRCDLGEEEEEDLEGRCVCGPKGNSVFTESYAPQDDGTAFWCSAIGILYERCERSNKCPTYPEKALVDGETVLEQPCAACRSLFEEQIVDCWRPKASTYPSSYVSTTYIYGADPNFKNRRFIGTFFGVLIGLIVVVAASVFACKKCRSKSVGDGSKDVVPKEDA